MCDFIFKKTKSCAGTQNRTTAYVEAAVRMVLEKRSYEKFCETHNKTTVLEKRNLVQVFFCKSPEICRNTFLQNTTGRLLLIIVVSMVEFTNETVNYNTKT